MALPFTILADPDTVRLVAGEDFRYTWSGPGLETWLPDMLARMDGRRPLRELLDALPAARQEPALELVERMYGERILVDGTALESHVASRVRLEVHGEGDLARRLMAAGRGPDGPPLDGGALRAAVAGTRTLHVLCQERLDHAAALSFDRTCRTDRVPWLWVSTGAMSRGYVSPPFRPDAGPCLACLVGQFRSISPAREVHDHLIAHGRAGRPVEPVPFPAAAAAALEAIVHWKAEQLGLPRPPAALYRLHVLETETMEVSCHRVFRDPGCPHCGPPQRPGDPMAR
jgi:bacteriocin biosynthesis cyclodehydratase domain-containing protein